MTTAIRTTLNRFQDRNKTIAELVKQLTTQSTRHLKGNYRGQQALLVDDPRGDQVYIVTPIPSVIDGKAIDLPFYDSPFQFRYLVAKGMNTYNN